jgi:hypothetical protein
VAIDVAPLPILRRVAAKRLATRSAGQARMRRQGADALAGTTTISSRARNWDVPPIHVEVMPSDNHPTGVGQMSSR